MIKQLFTRDFTIFIIGSLVCSIADVAMSFVMSVIVYEETASTLLSGIFFATSFLPNILVPLLFSPWVDNNYKKPFLVGCDLLIGLCYFVGYFVFGKIGFNYFFFMVFDLVCGCIGAIYQIAYQAYLPCLVEEELMQKGYTIFSMTYPICSIIFAPIASYVYEHVGVSPLLLCVGILMMIVGLLDISLKEKGIKKDVSSYSNRFTAYIGEIKYAIGYLRKEKGLNKWYYERAISDGLGSIRGLMRTAFFVSNPALGLTLYSFLNAAAFAGRMIGSIFNFNHKYENSVKAKLTLAVYTIYEVVDTTIIFLPYYMMLIIDSIAGFLGVNTFVLRESAIINYIPDEDRGKINSLLSIRSCIFQSIASVFGGYLGDIFGIKTTMLMCGVVGMLAIFFFVFLNLDGINKIFTYRKPKVNIE